MGKLGIGLVVLLGAVAGPADAATGYSWGKPDASRDAFEGGSRDCMLKAARRDVANDRSTKHYVDGTRVLDREANVPALVESDDVFVRTDRHVLLRRMYNPDKQVDALQSTLQTEVDQCLVKAGYIRFALTREQARQLRKLTPGSEPRKAYLYRLGSDRRIVEAQKVAD